VFFFFFIMLWGGGGGGGAFLLTNSRIVLSHTAPFLNIEYHHDMLPWLCIIGPFSMLWQHIPFYHFPFYDQYRNLSLSI